MKITLIIIAVLVFTFFKFGHLFKDVSSNNLAEEMELKTYSGIKKPINSNEYSRYILAKNTNPIFLKRMIKEYGEISGSENTAEKTFGFTKLNQWYIIKIDSTISFYFYHNLVAWFNGYDDNPSIPEVVIGFSTHYSNPKEDYLFHLDPTNNNGDTQIGAFRNEEDFFAYLPEAYDVTGNIELTEEVEFSFDEIAQLLSKESLSIDRIKELEFKTEIITITD